MLPRARFARGMAYVARQTWKGNLPIPMRYSKHSSSMKFYCCSLVILIAAIASAQTSSYSSPLPKAPKPFLKAPTYKGPPLSTALPRSGAFSGGLKTGTTSGTQFRPNYRSSNPYHPIAPVRPYPQLRGPQPYLPTPSITGRSISQYAISRGITSGLNF